MQIHKNHSAIMFQWDSPTSKSVIHDLATGLPNKTMIDCIISLKFTQMKTVNPTVVVHCIITRKSFPIINRF